VMRAAQAFVDRSPILTPMPDDQCCDRVAYTVTIVTADGSTHTYQTLDGLQQPPVFERLLSALS